MDSRLLGNVADLKLEHYHVSLTLELKKQHGHVVVDYRTNAEFKRQVGSRALINIVGPVHARFTSTTASDQGYDIALVHHSRVDTTLPGSLASVARQRNSLTLTRSQAIRVTEGDVGYAANVTTLIEPNPQFGHSPRLVVYFTGFGLTTESVGEVVVHFTVEATGDATPSFT